VRAEGDFEQVVQTIQAAINALGSAYLSEAKKSYSTANQTIRDAQTELDKVVSSNERYEVGVQAIEDACNAVLRVYRDSNEQVRDLGRCPAPAYFSHLMKLKLRDDVYDRKLIERMQQALVERDKGLKASFEGLEKAVPVQARSLLSEAGLKARLEELELRARKEFEKESEKVD